MGKEISSSSNISKLKYVINKRAAGTRDATCIPQTELFTERGHDQATVKRPKESKPLSTPESGEVLGTPPQLLLPLKEIQGSNEY
jgi:hypothetical protein